VICDLTGKLVINFRRMMTVQQQPIVEKKKFECPCLPKGWIREEIIRKTGLSAGKIDVVYYSPNGKKFKTKPQLSRYLGDSFDLSGFDFQTGKVNNLLIKNKNKKPKAQIDYSRGVRNDASLLPPIRQTASIFKQPVTVVKTQKSQVKHDFKHGHQEKPKQVFWEKRLEGLKACDADGEELESLELPKGVEAMGPHVANDTVLQSVATALHLNGQPITGQTANRTNLDSNPGVFVNPEQPLIQALAVAEDDIRGQEERVMSARKKLEEAIKSYYD